eukprot:TRINITY_DN5021_c0_g1_i2.p1 TRINITY_DN5021_c0_g1~~TRINITY_DN5021_c0_g1_i2.p1  ORF type:complete len:179 (-),score=10.03 TRINITY_DN5021_c0_g1_i2:133-669(-)
MCIRDSPITTNPASLSQLLPRRASHLLPPPNSHTRRRLFMQPEEPSPPSTPPSNTPSNAPSNTPSNAASRLRSQVATAQATTVSAPFVRRRTSLSGAMAEAGAPPQEPARPRRSTVPDPARPRRSTVPALPEISSSRVSLPAVNRTAQRKSAARLPDSGASRRNSARRPTRVSLNDRH